MAKITEILKEYNFTNTEGTDENGYTVLHLTVINKKFTEKEMIDVLKILIDSGVDPNIQNKKNETVLHIAVKNRMKDIIAFLLTRITDINSTAHFFIKNEYQKFYEFTNQTKLDSEIRRVETESASFVEWLISKGFDFDCKNERNQSALRGAIDLNLQHILPALLKCTKEIHSVDQKNRTLLHFFLESKANNYGINKNWYSKRYEAEIVKILLDAGVSVDTEDNLKRTPIEIAIENEEDIHLIETLLELLTNINKKNYEDEALFQMVIRKWINSAEEKKDYYLKIAQALVAKGADLNEPDKFGKRPLVYAIEKRNLRVIEFLRENGADFNITTENGQPLIHLVFASIYMNTGDKAEMTIFKLLLKHATNIHHKNSEGDTLFHMLIWKWICSPDTENEYYMKIARALINKGADVNEPNDYGTRPLFYAVERCSLCIVEFLGEIGADFNVTTAGGETLLHYLINSNNDANPGDYEMKKKLFDIILERSTNVHHENSEGDTPFRIVIRKWATAEEAHAVYYMKMARALKVKDVDDNVPDKYYGKTLPFNAIEKHNLGIVEFLEENGADFSMRTEDGETLIHLFVKNKWKTGDDDAEMKLFKLLISKGCQVNAGDKTGTTPLHVAAQHSNAHVVRMLIEHGARVCCRNNEMETPLHFAMRNPKVEVVAGLLLKFGANVNAKDSRGQTPLHKLAIEPRTEHSCAGLQKLLGYGADVNARDSENRTVLSCARSRDRADLLLKCELRRRQRAANGDGDYPPIIRIEDLPLDMASDLVIALAIHSIRLKAADFPWDEQINGSLGHFQRPNGTKEFCERYYEKCVIEIHELKCTAIDGRTSLYDFLHMNPNRKRGYVNNEVLKKFIRSPLKLGKYTFPVYASLILTSYREAAVRKVFLEPARKVWLKLTKISLPAVCLDLIFSFLSNSELLVMLGIGN